jgi:hypothetical protein
VANPNKRERSGGILKPIATDFETAVRAMLGTALPQNPDKVKGSRAVNFRKPTFQPKRKRAAKKR